MLSPPGTQTIAAVSPAVSTSAAWARQLLAKLAGACDFSATTPDPAVPAWVATVEAGGALVAGGDGGREAVPVAPPRAASDARVASADSGSARMVAHCAQRSSFLYRSVTRASGEGL